MTRILNLLLIVASAVALVLLVGQRRELGRLESEHDRLASRYGILDVQDPSQFVVLRIATDDPRHFAWRVHYPANLRIQEYHRFAAGGRIGGSSMYSDAGEYLHRCRFEFTPRTLLVHLLDRSGGGRMGIGNKNLREFLSEHWDELDIDVLAETGTVTVSTDEVLPFLVISIPEHLRDELVERFGQRDAKRYLNQPLFESVYGTKQAIEAYQE